MTNYGYGKSYESLYLKAYELAKAGNPTLLFSCETDIFKLHKILISYIEKIEMKKLNNPTEEELTILENAKNHFVGVPFFIIAGEKNIPMEEIENVIRSFKSSDQITEVVFDYIENEGKISQLGSQLGVNIHY